METLDLENKSLTLWPREEIDRAGAANIRVLNLSRNSLTNIPGDELAKLTGLQELNVSDNQLTAIPPEIGRLQSLQRLFASKNQLTALPAEIGQLVNLQRLGIGSNQLTTLPPDIGRIAGLRQLFLFGNPLTCMPEHACKSGDAALAYLRSSFSLADSYASASTSSITLHLPGPAPSSSAMLMGESCATTHLHSDSAVLPLLASSSSSTPALASISAAADAGHGSTPLPAIACASPASSPPAVDVVLDLSGSTPIINDPNTSLPGMLTLNLELNCLTAWPTSDIEHIGPTSIRGLHLNYNKIKSIPGEQLAKMTQLQGLFLMENVLQALPPAIGQLVDLVDLILTGNQLTALPSEIWQLTNLHRLGIDDNQLTELPSEIGLLTNLQQLYLCKNRLTMLPTTIGQLTNLRSLELAQNQLTALPPEIGSLTKLSWLDLHQNQLTTLPPELRKIPKLFVLDFTSNCITELPPEMKHLAEMQKSDGSIRAMPPYARSNDNTMWTHMRRARPPGAKVLYGYELALPVADEVLQFAEQRGISVSIDPKNVAHCSSGPGAAIVSGPLTHGTRAIRFTVSGAPRFLVGVVRPGDVPVNGLPTESLEHWFTTTEQAGERAADYTGRLFPHNHKTFATCSFNAEDDRPWVELHIHTGPYGAPSPSDIILQGKVAPQKELHKNVTCDVCATNKSIEGPRFKCSKCSNFDLCQPCHVAKMHTQHIAYRCKPARDGFVLCFILHTGNRVELLGESLDLGSDPMYRLLDQEHVQPFSIVTHVVESCLLPQHVQQPVAISAHVGAASCTPAAAVAVHAASASASAFAAASEWNPQSMGVSDVCEWLRVFKFGDVAPAFEQHCVNGKLLLELSDAELRDDLGITSSLKRKRLLMEISHLSKSAALRRAPPLPAGYEYHAFITYRRTEGRNLLANLVKSELDKYGYSVFFDLESLQGCVFDSKIFCSLRRSCCDIFVLSPGTLDRCLTDTAPTAALSNDWVRKEIAEACRMKKAIIPLVDDPKQRFPTCDGLPSDMAAFPRHNAIFFVPTLQQEIIARLCRHIDDAVARTIPFEQLPAALQEF